ncbi:MAG: ribosome-binding factor A [Xanthomonadaceae bacterium]|nr:ribosome-binding factor A [Rhodospirillaceae bacterium]NIA17702.1 ribosome-binding factor A [Xanthomonadaceae bacterium]
MQINYRYLQMNESIKKELGDIMSKNIDFPKNCLVTIIKVKTLKDCKEAKIYISVLPDKFKGKILTLLNKRTSYFKHLICKRLSLKHSPLIKFLIEDEEKNLFE